MTEPETVVERLKKTHKAEVDRLKADVEKAHQDGFKEGAKAALLMTQNWLKVTPLPQYPVKLEG